MYQRLGYYLQMVAAFLLLALTHYFASGFLPIADCDETFNFIEPVHYLLYGSGKQTWELCSQYALRSWLFSWMYAWPAVFIRGAASLSSADVYFYLRIFNGRIAALAELFFVYSVWSAFSGKAAMVALLLLLVNYPIPHAAVSVLPTSFVMICNFVVLGCWLRTRAWTATTWSKARAKTLKGVPPHLRWCVCMALFFSVFGGVAGWPFAGVVAVPIGLDLLLRFPKHAILFTAASFAVVVAAGMAMDARYYCRWTLSGWNVVLYNVFGGANRGPDLFDVEPWHFFWKNLTLNFHLMFVAVLLAPLIVLCTPRREPHSRGSHTIAGIGGSTSSFSTTIEPMQRFASAGDLRAAAVGTLPGSPTSPLTRARLHRVDTPERRSPLLSARHPHLALTAASITHTAGCSRGRELLYMTPFFAWFGFWMCVAHKEERFMSPAYPFMVLAATRAICFLFFPSAEDESREATPTSVGVAGAAADEGSASASSRVPTSRPTSPPASTWTKALVWRRYAGLAFLVLFFLLSYSRAMAVYTFYSGPERVFYDWYPVLRAEAQRRWAAKATLAAREGGAQPLTPGTTAQQARELNAYFTLCLGREWYRFPSSFFVDHRWTRYQFLNTSHFHGMLPVSFVTAEAGHESGFLWSPPPPHSARGDAGDREVGGSCTCGAPNVNDLNQEIKEQYVQDPVRQCDAVFDSLPPPTHVTPAEFLDERRRRHLDTVFTRSLLNATVLRAVVDAEGEVFHHVDEAYAVMDVDRTPMWCRVLYYPFGISKRCAVWRPLVLHAKEEEFASGIS